MRTGDLQENRIIRALTRVFDLMVLNVLCLLTSLPVVTAGASLTALYSVTMKMRVREEGYIVRDYLKAFRKNLKTGTIEFIIIAAAEFLIVMDMVIIYNMGSGVPGSLMTGLMIIAELIWFITVTFVFPVTAVSEDGPIRNLRSAVTIALGEMPRSAAVLMTTAACCAVTILNETTIMFGSVIWMLIGIAALAYFNSGILREILQPHYR
jgi:uncharacterized membrane protein YesL